MKTRIRAFLSQNIVFFLSLLAAGISMCFVPPDATYATYLDYKTIACLFSVLAVVCALKNIHFFTILADKIVRQFKTARFTVLALVYITFLGSMLIANDMALLTFLPLGYFVLQNTGNQKYMAYVFVLQNIAANLGGMLTPFGNPQNLYLYSYFSIPNGVFLKIMAAPFLIAVLLITVCCLAVPNEPLQLTKPCPYQMHWKRTVCYLLLFALAIAIVFRTIPYWIGPSVILAALLFLDRKALRALDYPLLLTFVCFFIFAGNMARLSAVQTFFASFLNKNVLLFSILSCQCISNVPSAILLSHFTGDYPNLLRGVNIGGVGTLIASLASLITFREYQKHHPEQTKHYLLLFSILNFSFLLILTLCCTFLPL